MDKKFIDILKKSQIELQKEYTSALSVKNREQANILKSRIQSIVAMLKEEYYSRAEKAITQEYIGGYISLEPDFGDISHQIGKNIDEASLLSYLNKTVSMMTPPHKEAIKSLIDTSYGLVSTSFDGLERNYNLLVGNVMSARIRDRIAVDMAKGSGLYSSKKAITQMLQSMNTTIRDSAGRKRNLGTYAEMVVRTERARAQNTAIVNKALEMGVTKFMVHEKVDCCDICAKHNGKIYDITKGEIDLPPYHPNCKGSIEPIFEDIIPPEDYKGAIVTDPRIWEKQVEKGYLIDIKYLKSKGLNPREVNAIKKYNSSGYHKTNQKVLNGEYFNQVGDLSSGLSKLDKYHGTVYRGTKLTTGEWEKYYSNLNVGDTYTHTPFMSSSYTRDYLKHFSMPSENKPVSVVMEIVSKNGRYTSNDQEKEILFNKGTKFIVKGLKITDSNNIIYLEELS